MHLHSRPQGLNAGLCLLSSIHKNPLRQGLCWLSHSLLKIITNPKSEAKRNFSILERIKTCTLNTLTECTGPALDWNPADSASLPKVRVLKGFPTGRSAVPLSPLHLSTSVGKLKCQFIVLPFVLRAASMFYVHVLYASVFWQEVHPMKSVCQVVLYVSCICLFYCCPLWAIYSIIMHPNVPVVALSITSAAWWHGQWSVEHRQKNCYSRWISLQEFTITGEVSGCHQLYDTYSFCRICPFTGDILLHSHNFDT